jgi:succinate dehydrogenase / fumarate reductase cytochrome b subunit
VPTALAVGTLLLVWWLLAAAAGPAAYAQAQAFIGSWFGVLLLIGWAYALFFHLCNGVRHLVWDTGHGFDLATTYASGWAVVAASAVLTLIAVVAGIVQWQHG